ncbi:hypothetical protein FACS1894162_4960 [Bacteroidia bacterium]|nr:hypothetical protein FACS1894162_4960 [Bacteroidia bacterium]
MKKLIFLFSIAATMAFSSCLEEKENWYSATSAYDGRFVVSTTCDEYSSDDVPLSDGMEMWVFNSAENVANEIWIDHFAIAGVNIKAKLNVVGEATKFNTAESFELAANSGVTYVLVNGDPVARFPVTASVADEIIDCVTLYTRIGVENGGIVKNGATTPGGNKSDSIYLKTTLYSDFFQYISYETDPATWTNPSVPEYDWKIVNGSITNAAGWEEHWTIAGYRYTGFPEDTGMKPPITEN